MRCRASGRAACLAACLLALTLEGAWGQDLINSSPNITGSGARALGMGGAFIAVADDATAASWNPAGLTQLERPEFSLVLSYKRFGESFKTTPFIEPDGDFHVSLEQVNFASFVYPFPRSIGNRNFVVSLNYQRQLDFDAKIDLRASQLLPGLRYIQVDFDIDYEQTGSLSSLSPAFAFELTNRLSMGLAINLWDSDFVPGNGWKTRNRFRFSSGIVGSFPIIRAGSIAEDFDNVKGLNYTFGLMYRPTAHLSIGAVYHTKFTADVNYRRVDRSFFPVPFRRVEQATLRFEFPSAVGLGLAYRLVNDKLTLSFDVTRREWDQFVRRNARGGLRGRRVSPITGLPKELSPHDATYTVRLGAEYVFVNENRVSQSYLPTIRAGVFYDPAPASGRKDTFFGTSKGDGDPDDYYGISLGLGLLMYHRLNVDFAYQFRWGNDVRRDTFAGASPFESQFSEDVRQHTLNVSTTVYF